MIFPLFFAEKESSYRLFFQLIQSFTKIFRIPMHIVSVITENPHGNKSFENMENLRFKINILRRSNPQGVTKDNLIKFVIYRPIHRLIYSFIRSFIGRFVDSFTHSFVQSFSIQSFLYWRNMSRILSHNLYSIIHYICIRYSYSQRISQTLNNAVSVSEQRVVRAVV